MAGQDFLVGLPFRFVPAIFLSSFSDMDFAIPLEAPLRLDFGRSPRLAAKAAPAAICWFLDFAGMGGGLFPAAPLTRANRRRQTAENADRRQSGGTRVGV